MKKLLLLFGLAAFLTLPFAQTSYAADPFNSVCNNNRVKNLPDDQKPAACREDGAKNPISGGTDSVLFKITQLVSVIAGAVAVIIIIIGGISMMTSGGDSQKFANGRNTLIFAAVGLIIIVLAQAIITLVINRVTAA
jgi:type IV secretory pathway VirB2 component (pilin)